MNAKPTEQTTLFGLADCNNFYCSCERVFHPELNGRPVVVLSNNDGCIIARSEEAKSLGLKMGTPCFQVEKLLEDNHVAVFSSNYTLYGDMSKRVMSLLSTYTPNLQTYSIDEAFLDFSGLGDDHFIGDYGRKIAARVKKATGIPISVGVAHTRTLAKAASKFAKKHAGYHGCCLITTEQQRRRALQLLPIGDVWGIGRRLRDELEYLGIHTAADFCERSERWVRSRFSINAVRTWRELQGRSCIEPDDLPYKKSICTSRSFAEKGITDHGILEEAVANFAARCATKLRKQQCSCRSITVFAHTSRFLTSQPGHIIQRTRPFAIATNDTGEIVATAVGLLRQSLTSLPYAYKRAGVVLQDIKPTDHFERDFFDEIDRNKRQTLNETIDRINRRWPVGGVKLAVQGTGNRFAMKQEHVSQHYTTDPSQLLVVKV